MAAPQIMTNIALEHFRTMSEHVPNAGREHYSDNRRPAGIQYHTAIILLIISLLACYIPNISPDIADVGCEVLTHVSPVFAKLVCADIKYNIPNIGKIFHYGASVFEQVNITGASAENRARLAVEISEGYRAMTDLKTLVKQSDIPNRVELTGALQSYATNARNTAELIMETDFQTKTTLDKFIRLTRYLASVLEDAQGKNMGRAVRILWSEFTNGIEKNVKALNAVINLAAESKTRLRNLGEELIEIHELIIEAKKIADILVAPEKEIHVLSGLWIRIGQSEKDYSQDLELLGKLERQRELDADRVEKTSQLLHKYLRYLEGMREPANDIVLSKNSKNADGYVQLINSMNGALERMANVKKSIEAEPVVLAK